VSRCGVIARNPPFDTRKCRVKDLPFGERLLQVVWRKRRYCCVEGVCAQKVFRIAVD